jgi:hypothetical protein
MTPITTSEVGHLISSMTRKTGPLTDDREWSVVREWPSFSARFVLVESGDERVLVKLGTNWAPGQSEFIADEVRRVTSILARLETFDVAMPEVLGVLADPPALAMSYVEGPLLFDELSTLDATEADRLVSTCGAVLGGFHSSQVAEGGKGRSGAMEELLGAAKRAGISRQSVLSVEPQLVRARGYRFSPNDFLLDPSGKLVVLDPPHVDKYDYVHRDLGSFTMELHRAIIGDRPPGPDSDLATLDRLVDVILTAYASVGPIDPRESRERWVIRLFETGRIGGVARGRLRQLKIGAFVRASRWAVWSRRRLVQLQGAPDDADIE